MIERTNVVFALAMPLRWLGRETLGIAVVGWPLLRPWRRSAARAQHRSRETSERLRALLRGVGAIFNGWDE
jgi:hypothetical protein